jgi:ectoine hydroxylase-related dioxygenase (phytanoyl-CoA dioxygenase family)
VSDEVSVRDIERYQADGVLLLPGLFRDWVEPLREGIEWNIAHPSPLERTYRPADGTAMFFQDYCNWQSIPSYRRFVYESPAACIAARLMGSRGARFFHEHVLVKEPGSSVATPWHQDQPYYCVEGRQSVSFWIALDPVARDIAVEYIAGSHRWGKDFRPMRFNNTPLYAQDDFPALPDINAHRGEYDIVGWAMAPGDAVAFNFRTVHGAPANRSAARRRAFSARWVGDDAVFVDRGGKTSPPFPELKLAHGAPLDAPEFPVVYRA